MIPVYQTRIGPNGDCFAACLASVLEMPIESVPDLVGFERWGPALQDWLEPMGLYAEFSEGDAPDDYAIGHVRDWTGGIHAAVYRHGRLVHDPDVRGRGRVDVLMWTALRRQHETAPVLG